MGSFYDTLYLATGIDVRRGGRGKLRESMIEAVEMEWSEEAERARGEL
jgi:hypothetical protein